MRYILILLTISLTGCFATGPIQPTSILEDDTPKTMESILIEKATESGCHLKRISMSKKRVVVECRD